MNIFEFGDAKLRLHDIDPIYTALWKSGVSLAVRQRFSIAETAFDHSGVAADVAEDTNFWGAMKRGIEQKTRGGSRRYFRGAVAFDSLELLQANHQSATAIMMAMKGTFKEILNLRNTFPQFGPRAMFKLADMAERVCCNRVDFSQVTMSEMCNNEQVLKGAMKACRVLKINLGQLLPALQEHRWATKASPRFDRVLNQQEFETLLCYYSHNDKTTKHYPGGDILDKKKELTGHGDLANLLIEHLPKEAK